MVNIFIAGYYGLGNIGDEIILSGVISSISKSVENPKFSVLTNDPSGTLKLHSVKPIKHSLKKGVSTFIKNQFIEQEFLNVIKEIKACDVFVLGGGELLQDLKIYYLPFLLSLMKIAQIRGKKTVVYGIGAGPIETKFGKMLSREVLKKADLITVRDKKSLIALEKCGLNDVIQTADPAFGVEKPSKDTLNLLLNASRLNSNDRYFGATFSHLLYNDDLYRKTNGPNFDWTRRRKILANIFDELIVEYDRNFLYYPTVKVDYAGCINIHSLMQNKNRVTIPVSDSNFYRTLAFTSSSDLLIGMRLHSMILSTIMGVPFVPLSYSSKVKSFLELVGLQKLYLDIEEIDGDDFNQKLGSNIRHVWSSRHEYSQMLVECASKLRSNALENGRLVSELVK